MSTLKRRLNISLPKDIDMALKRLADRDGMPQSAKALQLVEVALEIEEDQIWEKIASDRLKNKGKLKAHKDVWL
jgi:hypothetical protein